MIWASIGSERRGYAKLQFILPIVLRNVQEAYRHQDVKNFGCGYKNKTELFTLPKRNNRTSMIIKSINVFFYKEMKI
jgi:hypothetical protein